MAFYYSDPFFTDPFESSYSFDPFYGNTSLENRIANTLGQMLDHPSYYIMSDSCNENENENKNEVEHKNETPSDNKMTNNKNKESNKSVTSHNNSTSLYDWINNYKTFQPRIDIIEAEKNYQIHADLPGIKKEDVKLDLSEDGILSISGERKYQNKTESKDKQYYTKIERSSGKFKRSFTLPEDVDTSNIQAKMEDGVLRITINKKELPKKTTQSIQIQ